MTKNKVGLVKCCSILTTAEFFNSLSHKRKLASPKEVEHWSLTTLREKLIKIGAKVVRHGRYVRF